MLGACECLLLYLLLIVPLRSTVILTNLRFMVVTSELIEYTQHAPGPHIDIYETNKFNNQYNYGYNNYGM